LRNIFKIAFDQKAQNAAQYIPTYMKARNPENIIPTFELPAEGFDLLPTFGLPSIHHSELDSPFMAFQE
jgi:hypothetical protein